MHKPLSRRTHTQTRLHLLHYFNYTHLHIAHTRTRTRIRIVLLLLIRHVTRPRFRQRVMLRPHYQRQLPPAEIRICIFLVEQTVCYAALFIYFLFFLLYSAYTQHISAKQGIIKLRDAALNYRGWSEYLNTICIRYNKYTYKFNFVLHTCAK